MKHSDLLLWNADMGFGFYPCDPSEAPYNADYVAKYEAMANTHMAERLNQHRTSLAMWAADLAVENQTVPTFIDIGPGDGAYMRALSEILPEGEDFSYGFDVNPVMIARLQEEKRWAKPEDGPWSCMTFWDSFEHILRPDKVIAKAKTVAMSIPIFGNRDHALGSKHFRPDEHVWYFTKPGIIAFMKREGFQCVHVDSQETRIGREDIKSFVFKRTA